MLNTNNIPEALKARLWDSHGTKSSLEECLKTHREKIKDLREQIETEESQCRQYGKLLDEDREKRGLLKIATFFFLAMEAIGKNPSEKTLSEFRNATGCIILTPENASSVCQCMDCPRNLEAIGEKLRRAMESPCGWKGRMLDTFSVSSNITQSGRYTFEPSMSLSIQFPQDNESTAFLFPMRYLENETLFEEALAKYGRQKTGTTGYALAERIARDFMSTMNPSGWDGKGKMPDDFDLRVKTYDIHSKNGNELDISFSLDENPETGENEWSHYCELRDRETGDLMVPLHGYDVDSVQNLTDTILDICKDEWD